MDDHDPLCPAPLCDFGNPDAECIDPYECDHRCDCALIARVREDERAAALRDAKKAVLAVDYGDWLIRRTVVVEAIWALIGTDPPPMPMTHTCPDNNCCMGDPE